MLFLSLLLFICVCIAFCYLYYKIVEINKDIEILYKNYSYYIESSFKTKINERKSILQ